MASSKTAPLTPVPDTYAQLCWESDLSGRIGLGCICTVLQIGVSVVGRGDEALELDLADILRDGKVSIRSILGFSCLS